MKQLQHEVEYGQKQNLFGQKQRASKLAADRTFLHFRSCASPGTLVWAKRACRVFGWLLPAWLLKAWHCELPDRVPPLLPQSLV